MSTVFSAIFYRFGRIRHPSSRFLQGQPSPVPPHACQSTGSVHSSSWERSFFEIFRRKPLVKTGDSSYNKDKSSLSQAKGVLSVTLSYHDYWLLLFLRPALLSVLFLILAAFCIRNLLHPGRSRAPSFKVCGTLVCCIVLLAVLLPQIQVLTNLGIPLLSDRDAEAVSAAGVIEEITSPSKRAPAYNGGHGEGADFRMDGATYFASNAGDFQAGEQVHFSYLPNSHVLTNIVPADHGPSQAAPAATTWQDWFIVVLLVAVMLGIVLSIRKEKAKAAPM